MTQARSAQSRALAPLGSRLEHLVLQAGGSLHHSFLELVGFQKGNPLLSCFNTYKSNDVIFNQDKKESNVKKSCDKVHLLISTLGSYDEQHKGIFSALNAVENTGEILEGRN